MPARCLVSKLGPGGLGRVLTPSKFLLSNEHGNE